MPQAHRKRPSLPSRSAGGGPTSAPLQDDQTTIDHLVSGLAHDINNHLAAIQGHLELARIASDPARLTQRLEGAERAVARAAILVRRLLAVSRRAPAVREQVDLNFLASRCADEARRAKGEVRVAVELDPELARIEGNGAMLEQAIATLLARACVSASTHCSLTVRTVTVELGEDEVRETAWVAPGTYARIEIAGRGLGPSPGAGSPFFDPFLGGALAGGAGGREMAVVYAIVKHHRGYIHAVKIEGGMAIQIDLPVI
jgi:two-component system cell cycle sensor histidine kinase/response regulator CckA